MSRRFRIAGKLPSVKFPLHYEGAPSRRLYFPEWYVTLAEPKEKMPKNYVRLHVPADMTKYDVKEYMDKIYNVKIFNVKLSIVNYVRYKAPNPWQPDGGVRKWKFIEPWKIAHIFLAHGETFEWPNVFKNEHDDENEETAVEQHQRQQEFMKKKKQEQSDDKNKQYFENTWF